MPWRVEDVERQRVRQREALMLITTILLLILILLITVILLTRILFSHIDNINEDNASSINFFCFLAS